jgi:hypothetical protein
MIALLILLFIVLLLIWILLSPIELFIDTRFPIAVVHWRTIGKVSIRFQDDQFWLRVRVLFFEKQWCLKHFQTHRKKARTVKKKTGKTSFLKTFPRMWKMITTFKVKQVEVAFSPQDYSLAGQLYPLNYLPISGLQNVVIYFNGENYIVARIVSEPWRMMYAFIRK